MLFFFILIHTTTLKCTHISTSNGRLVQQFGVTWFLTVMKSKYLLSFNLYRESCSCELITAHFLSELLQTFELFKNLLLQKMLLKLNTVWKNNHSWWLLIYKLQGWNQTLRVHITTLKACWTLAQPDKSTAVMVFLIRNLRDRWTMH